MQFERRARIDADPAGLMSPTLEGLRRGLLSAIEASTALGSRSPFRDHDELLSWVVALVDLRLTDVKGHLAAKMFVDEHWDEIESAAATATGPVAHSTREDASTFTFWDSGFTNAPRLVQTCHRAWERSIPAEDFRVVTDQNLDDYLRVPEYMSPYRTKHRALFSDWLRFALLESYGGTWLDATTYPGLNFSSFIGSVRDGGGAFFAPRRHDRAIATGFLWARQSSRVVRLMKSSLDVYFRRYASPFAYFQAHYIFVSLMMRDSMFAREFGAMAAMDGHRWQRIWIIKDREFRAAEVRSLLREIPVHKLSYKYDDSEVRDGSVLDRLLESGTLWERG